MALKNMLLRCGTGDVQRTDVAVNAANIQRMVILLQRWMHALKNEFWLKIGCDCFRTHNFYVLFDIFVAGCSVCVRPFENILAEENNRKKRPDICSII